MLSPDVTPIGYESAVPRMSVALMFGRCIFRARNADPQMAGTSEPRREMVSNLND